MVDERDLSITNIFTPSKCRHKPDPMYFNATMGKLDKGETRMGKAECKLCTLYNVCYWINRSINKED